MTIERTRESVKDFYERRYAAAYMSGHRPLEVKRVRDVLSLIPPQAVRSVLDYGCGRGVWVPVLSEIFPGAGIAGTDISEAAVASAQASFRDVTFVVSDGSCAPGPTNRSISSSATTSWSTCSTSTRSSRTCLGS